MSDKKAVVQPSSVRSSDDVVLSVKGVSKKFCRDLKRSLLYGVQDIAGELVGIRGSKNDKLRKKEFWALQDVSFELRQGESLGLVGKNGSGKSTLLRVIAGLVKPDAGTVEVNGRVAPLIALGAGFNPVLTGRENIFANMAILGLSKYEIAERFDDVVNFSEIGDAIDSPLQSYSSGMAARLGFSSAIFTEPDVLLIDEVLAVGDVRFRMKCFRKLRDLRERGVSFIIVSHQSTSILDACKSAIYLSSGRLLLEGSASSVINRYELDLFAQDSELGAHKHTVLSEVTGKSFGARLLEVFFRDEKGDRTNNIVSGQPISVCIKLNIEKIFSQLYVYVVIKELNSSEDMLYLTNAYDNATISVIPGKYECCLKFPYLGLRPGAYVADISVREERQVWLDRIERFSFEVESDCAMPKNKFYQPRSWNMRSIHAYSVKEKET